MDIAEKIFESKENINYQINTLSINIKKEKHTLKNIIKLSSDANINLNNLKKKSRFFSL